MNKESSPQWYVNTHDGKEYGPIDLETLKRWIAEKRVQPLDLIKGSGDWVAASSVPEIKDAFHSTDLPA